MNSPRRSSCFSSCLFLVVRHASLTLKSEYIKYLSIAYFISTIHQTRLMRVDILEGTV